MRLRRYKIHMGDILNGVLKAFLVPEITDAFFVPMDGATLPSDIRFVRAFLDTSWFLEWYPPTRPRWVWVVLESASFDDVLEGVKVPEGGTLSFGMVSPARREAQTLDIQAMTRLHNMGIALNAEDLRNRAGLPELNKVFDDQVNTRFDGSDPQGKPEDSWRDRPPLL